MSEKKPFAAFTRCWDERYHMWLWLQHYVPAVGAENCYVFRAPQEGDQYAEMVAKYPGVTWFEDDHPNGIKSDEVWDMQRLKRFNDNLLETHDVVIMTDADELLIPTSGSLNVWLTEFRASDRRYARAVGYHVFENTVERGKLFRWRSPRYDKTSITKVSLSYRIGFHEAWDAPVRGSSGGGTMLSNDIELAHMPFANLDVYVNKCSRRYELSSQITSDAGLMFDGRDKQLSEQFFKTGVMSWKPDDDTFVKMRAYPREHVPSHWIELATVKL
jgi:hypothetical protein